MNQEEVLQDDFATDDEKDIARKLIQLEKDAHQGALFDDWMRHQAGQLFAKYLEGQITLAKNDWLTAEDREKAEVVRVQAQVYAKIKSWINAQIQTGKSAAMGIKQFTDEGEQLNGLIRSPQQRPS